MDRPYLLLIEDNHDDVYLTLRSLNRNGFQLPVEVLGSAEEALDCLERWPRLPLALLVSYRLPGLSGMDFINRIRDHQRTKDMVTVLLTASVDERDHVCGEECRTGANACLIKPIGYSELSESLAELQLLHTRAGEQGAGGGAAKGGERRHSQ